MQDELEPQSPRREFAVLALKEIERLDTLVGEFLRFARPSKLATELNDLNDIVESIASLVENQARSQRVVVEKNLSDRLPKIVIDGEQIRQVLLNLAVNALQAVGEDGRIVFKTDVDENSCLVEVSDSGSGIDETVLAKIFDPFVTTKDKGVGLGLSIAHKIVSEHGGTITVTSDMKGAVFTIRLPINAGLPRGIQSSV